MGSRLLRASILAPITCVFSFTLILESYRNFLTFWAVQNAIDARLDVVEGDQK